MKQLKLLVIGHGRHGKDTVCDILADKYNYTFNSSSRFCSELFIYESLKHKYGYVSEQECYDDRHNHREEWYSTICYFNKHDGSRLGKEIFKQYDIYCGLRNKKEYYAMKNIGLFDYAIWVDRSDHLPKESEHSMSLQEWMADYTIDNNEGLVELENNVQTLMNYLHKTNKAT